MKKIIVTFYLFGLSNIPFQSTTAHAEASLDAKIIAIDEQIRKEEQKQSHDAKKLADLVAEYNRLVQEQAANETPTSLEQTHEEGVTQRLKEHEQRIDQLEKAVAILMKKNGIAPITNSIEADSVATTTPSSHTTSSETTAIDVTTPTTAGADFKHREANLATEQAALGTTPSLDTTSPALAQFNQAMALLNAGIKSGSKEDLKNAVEAFELVTTTYPDETYADKAYVHWGDGHFKLGNIDEAQKCYKIAITKPLDQQNAIRARLGYGETLLSKNNKEDACAQIKILSKEILDGENLKRFNALLSDSRCAVTENKQKQ